MDRDGTFGRSPTSSKSDTEADTWLPLREASEQARVSVSALRKWYRLERIQSELRPGPTGDQRYVLLSEVMEQAGRLHRVSTPAVPVSPAAERPAQHPAPSRSDEVLPIPKDAWNKMIEQLGNLFEAGRALATEAAARAKAETEVQFLRERVSDLEEQLEQSRRTQPALDFGSSTPSPFVRPGQDTIDRMIAAALEAATATPRATDPSPPIYLPPDAMDTLIEEAKRKTLDTDS